MNRDEVLRRQREHIYGSVTTYYEEPIVLERGEGMRVWDADGSEYLDFFGGILTVSVGHCNAEVSDAVCRQVKKLGHTSTLYVTEPQAELAERLTALAPGNIRRAFFTNSGTEADETAVLSAQMYTGAQEVVALRHSYSGRSMLAMSLTAHKNWRIGGSHVAGIKHAASPYCYRCAFGLEYPSCDLRCARDIEELIQTTTSGAVAAFIAEPIQGVGGFITPPPEYFQVAMEIIGRYGGVFICDEVQTGFGRTGDRWFGIEHWGVEPDIITGAKGIANGLPMGATLATEEIAAAWSGSTISTFGGNPISSTAALATLDVMESLDVPRRAAKMGARLRDGLDELAETYPSIGEVRGMGLMQGVEIVREDKEPAADLVDRLFEETKERGLLIGRGGLYANVLRISPPMICDADDVDRALGVLKESFEAVEAGR